MATFGTRVKKFLDHVGYRHFAPSPMLQENFRRYGRHFGAMDFEAFEMIARQFYREYVHSVDPKCSRSYLPGKRLGIDYNSETRGIYDQFGNPIAFYAPDYQAAGFHSRREEREAWLLTADAYD